jgi:hypothetical protein
LLTQGRAAELHRLFAAGESSLDARHVQVILSCLRRRVVVDEPGDSDLVSGRVLSRRQVEEINDRLGNQIVIEHAGASGYRAGDVIDKENFDRECVRLSESALELPRARPARLVSARPRLDSRRAAARQGSLTAALCADDPLAVLRRAALERRRDDDLDLHTAAVRGLLIPAGTGFRASS